jgi:hypothetical protein
MNFIRKTPNLFFVIIIAILFLLNGCTNSGKKEEKQIIQNLMGKVLPLPDSIVTLDNYSLDTTSIRYFNSNIKIISLVDGRCPACINKLSKLIKAKKRLENKANKKIDFVFLVHTKNFKTFKNNFYPVLDPETPIIIQKDLSFLEENPLPGFGVYQTVLTVNNKIRLVGNPAINEDLESLYLDEINKQ